MRNYMHVCEFVFQCGGGGSVFPKRTKTICNLMNDLFFNQWGVGWWWGWAWAAGAGAQDPALAWAQGQTQK